MSPRNWVRVITLVVVTFVFLRPAFPQSKGTGTSTGSTGSTGSAGTLPTTGSTTTTTNSSTGGTAAPPPVMVSGRVMLEDGNPVTESVQIERICNGNARAEGYTDTKGYFVIQLGSGNSQFQDASESASIFGRNPPSGAMGGVSSGTIGAGMGGSSHVSGIPDAGLANCDLRARLAGYRSQTVSLIQHRTLDSPDVGIILLHRLTPAESAATVSTAALSVPKPADKAYNKGLAFLKKGRTEEARASFQSAIDLYPKFSSAWLELGKLQAINGQLDDAHKSFVTATQTDPQAVGAYLELALLALHGKNWSELADVTYRALKLNSFDYPQAYFLNAVANYNLQKLDTAEKSARAAQRLDTHRVYPENSRLLGVILVDRQQYSEAADALRDFLVSAPHAPEADAVRQQLDDLEKKTIGAEQVAKR